MSSHKRKASRRRSKAASRAHMATLGRLIVPPPTDSTHSAWQFWWNESEAGWMLHDERVIEFISALAQVDQAVPANDETGFDSDQFLPSWEEGKVSGSVSDAERT